MKNSVNVIHNDGGRAAAGFGPRARDCVTRAIAIASERTYLEVFVDMYCVKRASTKRAKSPDHGIHTTRQPFIEYMIGHGWVWNEAPADQAKFTVAHFSAPGRVIVAIHRHYTAMIDGVWHDRVRLGPRQRIKGYWSRACSNC